MANYSQIYHIYDLKEKKRIEYYPRYAFGNPSKNFNKKCKHIGRSPNETDVCEKIPGLRKLFDPSYAICGKILWSIAMLFCIISCGYQLFVLIHYYFSYPVVVDISILRNDSIWFPAITFCPMKLFTYFEEDLHKAIEFRCFEMYPDKNCTHDIPNDINIDIEEFWKQYSISDEDIERKTPCATIASKNSDNCVERITDFKMNHSYIMTLHGQCLALTPMESMSYRGPDTYCSFTKAFHRAILFSSVLSADEESLTNSEFFIHLFPPGAFSHHSASLLSEIIFKNYLTTIRLAAKEFRFLSTRINPCTDEATFAKCQDDCIDRKLNRLLGCRLPFVTSKQLRNCSSEKEIVENFHKSVDFYRTLKLSDCNCTRKCRDILYTRADDVGFQSLDGKTVLQLKYPINIHEIITEKYGYTLSNLLSDIVGNLGFYLGVCALTLVELIASFISKFTK